MPAYCEYFVVYVLPERHELVVIMECSHRPTSTPTLTKWVSNPFASVSVSVTGSVHTLWGDARDVRPSSPSSFFRFHAVFSLLLLPVQLALLSGKSWIRHWHVNRFYSWQRFRFWRDKFWFPGANEQCYRCRWELQVSVSGPVAALGPACGRFGWEADDRRDRQTNSGKDHDC